MHLATLDQVQKQLRTLDEKRTKNTRGDYLMGLRALKRAKASQFTDRQALKQANHRLMRAVQKNRQCAEPLIALAYLLIILGDAFRAQRYLAAALQLEPDNENAQALLTSVQQLGEGPAVENQLSHLEAQSKETLNEAELESRYEDLQRLLQEAVREWTSADLSTPCCTRENLIRQETYFKTLMQLCERFSGQLEHLEQDLDIVSLRRSLQMLEQLNLRAQNTFKISQEIVSLSQELDDKIQSVLSLYQLGVTQLNAQQIDALLDDCDDFADRLDELSETIDIEPLLTAYEELISLVNGLQNALDEQA